MSEKLVEVQHLQQYFPAGGMGKNKKYVQAVDDVSFAINKGETLGLVANPAAERPPRAARCCACTSRRKAVSSMTAKRCLTAEMCRCTTRTEPRCWTKAASRNSAKRRP